MLLGLNGASAVRAGVQEIEAAVAKSGHRLEGLIVQPMAASGVELLVGVVHDESFGPVIACGAGGTSVELLRDVAVRITPLSDLDAEEMLRSLRTFPLLDGYRGAAKCDLARGRGCAAALGRARRGAPRNRRARRQPARGSSGRCADPRRARPSPACCAAAPDGRTANLNDARRFRCGVNRRWSTSSCGSRACPGRACRCTRCARRACR